MKSVWRIGALLVFVGTVACSKELVNSEIATQCVQSSDQKYSNECQGRRGTLDGFVVRKEEHNTFFVAIDSPDSHKGFELVLKEPWSVNPGDKIRVTGVFGRKGLIGRATVSAKNATFLSPTEEEKDALLRIKESAQLEKKRKDEELKIRFAYVDCAKAFEMSRPGTSCPHREGGPGAFDGDRINITGICFFGGRSITFRCTHAYGRASITDTKFH